MIRSFHVIAIVTAVAVLVAQGPGTASPGAIEFR